VVLLQHRGAVFRGSSKVVWSFMGFAAEPKICQFEVQMLSKDDNISRFDVPVHKGQRLEVSSSVDQVGKKPSNVC